MIVLLAMIALAMIAGLFYGLGSAPGPRRPQLRSPAPLQSLPPASALPGADPTTAIPIPSPAVVEHHAQRWPCPVCASPIRCVGHRAEQGAGRRLRIAEVRCPRCGFGRDVYFELQLPH